MTEVKDNVTRYDDENGGHRVHREVLSYEAHGRMVMTPDDMRKTLEEVIDSPHCKDASSFILAFSRCHPEELVKGAGDGTLDVRPAALLSGGSDLVILFGLLQSFEGCVQGAVTAGGLRPEAAQPLLRELTQFGQMLASDLHRLRTPRG